jgi:hypothetical protein
MVVYVRGRRVACLGIAEGSLGADRERLLADLFGDRWDFYYIEDFRHGMGIRMKKWGISWRIVIANGRRAVPRRLPHMVLYRVSRAGYNHFKPMKRGNSRSLTK